MAPGNGQIHPGIPILGQPATVKNWACQVVATCNCAAKEPVLLLVGMVAECAACHQHYQITQVLFDGKTGAVQITIGVVMQRDAGAALQGVQA